MRPKSHQLYFLETSLSPRKEEEEEDNKPLPVLCATVCVVWNTEEEIEANPGQGLYTDSVPIIFDITKVAAIQADVEFRNDGSASIGSRTGVVYNI
jgi:hypothetical protein